MSLDGNSLNLSINKCSVNHDEGTGGELGLQPGIIN
jgi:hypothetical protein